MNLHFYQDAYLGKHILISAQASRLLRSFMSEMEFSCDDKPSNIAWVSVMLPWSEKNVSRWLSMSAMQHVGSRAGRLFWT